MNIGSSVRNLKLLKKAKFKTWAHSRSKVEETTQDLEQTDAQQSLPGEPVQIYKATFGQEATGLIDAHQVKTSMASTTLIEAEPENARQSSVSPSRLPLSKPAHVKNLKKVASLLILRKAKTEPVFSSPQKAPTALKQIEEEPNIAIYASQTSSSSNKSTHTSPTQTLTASSPPTLDPSTPLTEAAEESKPQEEHPENLEITTTKAQIRALKIADIASTRNAIRLALEARDTGLATLARLQEHSERLATASLRIDEAGIQTRIAGERIRTVRHATRMLHAPNPFFTAYYEGHTADSDSGYTLSTYLTSRTARNALRRNRWEEALRRKITICLITQGRDGEARAVIERGKYQFEPDSEDEAFEEEIEDNMGVLVEVMPVLREMAVQVGDEMVRGELALGRGP